MPDANKKQQAQNLTCLVAAVTCGTLSVLAMLFAIVFPAVSACSMKVTCWVSMGTELVSILLAYVMLWLKKNAL